MEGTSIQQIKQQMHESDPALLADDINNNLKETDDDTIDEQVNEIITTSQQKKIMQKLPTFLQEPVLLLIIYFILSLAPIRDFIGKNIKQVNPNDDGEVSYTGIIIYGSIFAIIYTIMKKYLL